MNEDLDTCIVPDRELTWDDCVSIWASSLTLAISDATGRPVKGQDRVAPTFQQQQEARQWLLNPSMSLALACDVTGVEMAPLNKWAKDRAASNWQIQ